MSDRLRRLLAIVRADVLIRFRRPSTLAVFLLLGAFVSVWVPDPSTGRALLVVDAGRRALYNSASMGLATALLATIFVGLAGFYAVSNAIRRDVDTRCGFIIAATTMRSSEYLAGKLCGNVVFLATFTAGFMVSAMAMLVVRNEAALEPWIFLQQYLLLVPPAIVCVAVLAIVFETVSWLNGRVGDVVYFVTWLACCSLPAAALVNGSDPGLTRYVDVSGLAFVFEQVRPAMQTANLSIGGRFDPAQPLFVFDGLEFGRAWWLPRLGSLLAPLPLLVIAARCFHHFDPVRVRTGGREKRTWLARLGGAWRPLVRVLLRPGARASARATLLRTAALDARLTLASFPVGLMGVLGVWIATLSTSAEGFARGVLPVALACVGILVAEVSCRERLAGTLGLVYAAPALQARFVWWKLLAAGLVALAVLAVPLLRVAVMSPAGLAPLVCGLFFVVSAATTLGILSATPKTFMVVFLTFLYAVTSDKGATPALDFAGIYGTATPAVMLAYVAAAGLLLAVAEVGHLARLRRER